MTAEAIEGIELSLEESDVDMSKPRRSIKSIASKVFAASSDVEDDNKQSKRGRPKKASKFFQSQSALFVGGAIALLSIIPGVDKTFEVNGATIGLAPTTDQMTAIIEPLLRIADRHTQISDIHPDVADVSACFLACVAYGFDLRSNILLLSMIQAKEQEQLERAKRENTLVSKSPIGSRGPTPYSEDE